MKILPSFTHPQVVSNLCEFIYSAEHKRRYFEEWKKILWKSMGSINCLVTDILQNVFFFCSAGERNHEDE